jgi:hypothetical protein
MSEENTNALALAIERIQREIQTLRDTAHILTPMARTKIDSVAIGKVPVLRVAAIDPDPTHGDVYEIRQLPGRFALSKVGLQRLEAIAGITGWTTKVEHALVNVTNEKGQNIQVPDPLHVVATAYAEIEDIDGTKRGKPQTYELNLNDNSPQAEKMVKVKDGKRDDRELKQARANIIPLAESKAMNRVRRDLLNLQATFTRDELKKPFVIMRLVDAPLDPNDPLIRKLLIMKQLKITSEMFDSAVAGIPTPLEIPEAPVPAVLPSAPEPPNDPGRRAIEAHVALIAEVEELYAKKVRGGRSANKPPLSDLTMDELNQLKSLLLTKPDIA